MPTVQRQQARPQARPQPPPDGSVLSRAVPVASLEDDFIHMLLFGRNRVGKTTLACQFPKPLLLVGVEQTPTGGARSVKKVPGVTFLRVEDGETFAKLSEELAAGHTFKTVVIDSGTSLEEIVLAEVCGWDRTATMLAVGTTRPGSKVSQDQYTERSERVRRLLRPYLDLPCHLIITANEKDHNPQEGSRKSVLARGPHTESFFAAAMGGGTARWVQDCCDYVCQLFMDKEVVVRTRVNKVAGKEVTTESEEETGRVIRRLRCSYHPNYAAGFRSCDPGKVPDCIDEPTFAKIEAVIRGS